MTTPPIALEERDNDGVKLFSPSASRNKAVIAAWLSGVLPTDATVLEVGSGTGEHGAALGEVRQDIIWQYSDPDETSRASQSAWKRRDWPEPLALDLTNEGWVDGLGCFDAVYSANMIHIAPIEATKGLAIGAAEITDTVILYGPFLFGEDSAPSNLDFDASLKRRNPLWGVREFDFVKHIFANAGFTAVKRLDMPRNNFIARLSRP